MNRAGLLNFWYYDEEIFDFHKGKLLLRGSNGSGKSVTMQSFLPILLDAKKTPDRLDPFGSRSRRIEDYLLGEKEISNRDERTGYLFIEYKKEETGQYVTTGIGLQARRNKALKSWGFVITDNRRIKEDLELYKMEKQGEERVRVPLSKKELETVIGDGGEVVDTNQEYMELVNKHVFGFETIDAYQDLIELLIQLRSPKLSKDYKPTVIYEILEKALPPLTDEDLRYLSDTIEQMDQTKQQIEQLDREVKAIGSVKKAYDTYNHRYLYEQLQEWKMVTNRLNNEQRDLNATQQLKEQAEVELRQLNRNIQQLEADTDTQNHLKESLQSHKVWALTKQKTQQEETLLRLRKEYKSISDRLDKLTSRERAKKREAEDVKEQIQQLQADIAQKIDDLSYESEESGFTHHGQNADDYKRHQQDAFNFDVWKQEVRKHQESLTKAMDQMREVESLRTTIQSKRQEVASLDQERDAQKVDEKDWENTFSEDKARFTDEIHQWMDSHSIFTFENSAIQLASRRLEDLYDVYTMDQVKGIFQPAVEAYDQTLYDQRSTLQTEKQQVQQQLHLHRQEISEWQSKRDPEPRREDATKQARIALKEKNIAHAAFYEVIEFRTHVPSDVQKRIESALLDTGLLDALIVEDSGEIEHDRILKPNPQELAYTLADLIEPDTEQTLVSQQRVQEILQSILIGESDSSMSVSEDGTYQIGIMAGHALPVVEVRYIGREARKRYRQELIAALQEKIIGFEYDMQLLELKEDEIKSAFAYSKEAWKTFPMNKDLWESYKQIQQVRSTIKSLSGRIETLGKDLQALDKSFQIGKRDLHLLTQAIPIDVELSVYKQALTHMAHYQENLETIHRLHDRFSDANRNLIAVEHALNELELEVDETKGNEAIVKDHVMAQQAHVEQLVEQLKQEGAEDIQQQIQGVQAKLNTLEQALKQQNQALPHQLANQDKLAEKEIRLLSTVAFWRQLEESWKQAVHTETERGLIEVKGHLESLEDWLPLLEVETSRELGIIERNLTNAYLTSEREMTEYRMREYTLQSESEAWMEKVTNEDWSTHLATWKAKTTRRLVDFDKRGVKVSPNSLYQELVNDQLIQQNRLNQQDEALYKEILFNSVGNKLRARIGRAEKWTEKMREIMEESDSSSGLKFSIKWKARTADAEEQLDTKDLVLLLRKNQALLKDEDLERISAHFRSKIQTAKRWVEEKGDGQTLLQVLKMVLDYRKWFSFELSYEKPNEPKRELTNHKFFTFSGGEKAMAMYIPLFTACYSRYKEAADFAPYIVSLDEAFAGVDENNINEMFEIVEKLGFNYIMNSQVLWGDYETVKGLAICELVRPKNADFVTVIRYKWDGQRMVMEGS